MSRILITRPRPGAAETAARLTALGHEALVLPLFEVAPQPWAPPAETPPAIMLTSASAARLGGAAMADYFGLPCFCVGKRTAIAAQEAGFGDVRAPSARDGGELLAAIAAGGVRGVLHLAGLDFAAYAPPPGLRLDRRTVYAATVRGWTPAEHEAARGAEIALAYSPRGAEALAAGLGAARARIHLAAISQNAIEAAGEGWASRSIAAWPDEDALFAAAGLLCEKANT